MKEKQNSICANCGHLRATHKNDGACYIEGLIPRCPCKKFTPAQEPKLLIEGKPATKKEVMKLFDEPKNHSQELLPVQRGTDVLGKRLKPADTPSENSVKNSVVNCDTEGTSKSK